MSRVMLFHEASHTFSARRSPEIRKASSDFLGHAVQDSVFETYKLPRGVEDGQDISEDAGSRQISNEVRRWAVAVIWGLAFGLSSCF